MSDDKDYIIRLEYRIQAILAQEFNFGRVRACVLSDSYQKYPPTKIVKMGSNYFYKADSFTVVVERFVKIPADLGEELFNKQKQQRN